VRWEPLGWLGLRTRCVGCQTNNGLGDAWGGIRNRGGTPQHDRLKSHAHRFPNFSGKPASILVRGKILEVLIPTGERIINCRLFLAHGQRTQRQEVPAWTGANSKLEMMRADTLAALDQAVLVEE